MRTLKIGDRGDDVRELQRLLTLAGFTCKADAIFGPATAEAVRQYQAEHALQVDGIAGPKTLGRLHGEALDDTDPAIVVPIWIVDVSESQLRVPWAALAEMGCAGAILRGMTGNDLHGVMRPDAMLERHAVRATGAGIPIVGTYGWCSEVRDGAEQGALLARVTDGIASWCALDHEPAPGRTTYRDPARASATSAAFFDAAEAAGVPCLTYTAPYALRSAPLPPRLARRKLWLAHPDAADWPAGLAPWAAVDLWQTKGIEVDGVKLDKNIFRGSLADLPALGGS